VRLYLDEARALGLRNELAEEGADSDFTSIVKMMERAAGVIVGKDT
jgi:hypothetical protein